MFKMQEPLYISGENRGSFLYYISNIYLLACICRPICAEGNYWGGRYPNLIDFVTASTAEETSSFSNICCK